MYRARACADDDDDDDDDDAGIPPSHHPEGLPSTAIDRS